VLQPTAPPKFASFEKLRRDVDADPEKYLETNKAYTPDADAADFYLKGRAFLRLSNYFEAKQALLEAKKRLKPDSDDAATLDTEIALALAVIANAPASESLRTDLANWANAANAVKANSNTSTVNSNTANTNKAVNANR
jgi:hypothetical protein